MIEKTLNEKETKMWNEAEKVIARKTEKTLSLSEEIFRNYCPSNVIPEDMCKGHEFLHVLSVKKAIKRFNYVLDVIAIKLKSNDEEDWDVALKMVRDLRKDKYKIFGGKLIK